MSRQLIVRADASSTIGVGHVMRCLALAQAWQDTDGVAAFACATLPTSLGDRVQREGFEVSAVQAVAGSQADAEEVVQLARAADAAWIVVDGYRFGSDYYQHLSTSGSSVLALDDMAHLRRYPVGLLLNQNLSATRALYHKKTDDAAELLLGPRYSLLRREFRAARRPRRAPGAKSRRVLVSFGGSDRANLTGFVLQRLARDGGGKLEVVVLAGAASLHVAELQRLAVTLPFSCEVRVDTDNVAELMAWADVAIAAAGSTVWELASMRLPAVIAAIEDNQIMGMQALAQIPFFRVGLAEELIPWDLGKKIDEVIDGAGDRETDIDANGALRVVEAMNRVGAAAGELAVR